MTDLLFSLPAPSRNGPPDKTCQTCKHLRFHHQTRRIKYCAKKISPHTHNGMALTKSRMPACHHYEASKAV